MERHNTAAVRRIKNAFAVYVAEVQAAIMQLEHANNVINSSFPELNACLDAVCTFYRIEPALIIGKGRKADIAWARQVAMWLATQTTNHGIRRIGEYFHRDHSIVVLSVKSVNNRMETDKKAKEDVQRLLESLQPSVRKQADEP